jgi:DUF4097 and DUF4098 domain-containing protein YvlB
MKRDSLPLATATLAAAILFASAAARAQSRHRDFTFSVDGSGETCADLHVRSSGEIAQAADHYTLQRADVAVLEVNASDNGVIRVRGSARNDYSIDVCRIAAAQDRATADRMLQSLTVSHAGGRFTANGPSPHESNAQWQVHFIVHAPSDARVDLETKNGPVDIASITGGIKARSTNGPLSLKDCGGVIDAITTNGPISFSGSGGDVQLKTTNGPISLKLANDVWSGPRLEAHTTNGPLSLAVPDTFQTATHVENDGHSPVSCHIRACQQAYTDARSDRRILQLNGTSDTVRVSTTNGPISVGTENRKKII